MSASACITWGYCESPRPFNPYRQHFLTRSLARPLVSQTSLIARLLIRSFAASRLFTRLFIHPLARSRNRPRTCSLRRLHSRSWALSDSQVNLRCGTVHVTSCKLARNLKSDQHRRTPTQTHTQASPSMPSITNPPFIMFLVATSRHGVKESRHFIPADPRSLATLE